MPEETAAYQVYKHRGKPLNRPIIRAILRKCLVDRDVHRAINPQQNSLTVLEFKENISQYHQRNGGAPPQLRDPRCYCYSSLRELEGQGRAERCRKSRSHYWKLIPSYEDNTQSEE
jgi:hypothetical protein